MNEIVNIVDISKEKACNIFYPRIGHKKAVRTMGALLVCT